MKIFTLKLWASLLLTCFLILQGMHHGYVRAKPVGTTPVVTAPSTDSDGAFIVSWGDSALFSTSAPSETLLTLGPVYYLQQSTNGGGYLAIYKGSKTYKNISGLVTGTYTYRVKSCDGTLCSSYGYSGQVQVTISQTSPPAWPRGAAVSVSYESGTAGLNLGWTLVSDTTYYQIQENINGTGWAGTLNVSSNVTTKTMLSLLPGDYIYRVRACNQHGCSLYLSSTTVTITLPVDQCPVPL